MHIRVLGAAAGGGFPQWNCACAGCAAARAQSPRARPRTQECAAVSADGTRHVLLNASPEIRNQIESYPPLHPRAGRGSGIFAVVLTNADLDHVLGLLSLREGTPLAVFATASVLRAVRGNAFCGALEHLDWCELTPGRPVRLAGLAVTASCVPGKPPRYLERLERASALDNVALRIEAGAGRVLVYAPSVGHPTPELEALLAGAASVLFDGTFWSSDELCLHGYASRRAEDMAHWPVGGPEGSLAALGSVTSSRSRRAYIHVNNTNPMLLENSPERAEVTAAGWEVAYDGMELEL